MAGGRADWQVLVSERAEQDGQCINLRHGGIATSSTLARRWTSSTGPAHHIIDPRTRRPATSTWRSATVWAPTTAQANAWSTAAIVLGTDVLPLLERRTLAARLVDTTGRVRFAGDWPIPPTTPDVDRRLAVASVTLWYLARAAGVVMLLAFTMTVCLGSLSSIRVDPRNPRARERRLLTGYLHRAAAVTGMPC